MASMQKKGESWYCQFRFNGKRHTIAAGKLPDREVDRFRLRAEELLVALKRRTRYLPLGVSVGDFILSDGVVTTDPLLLSRTETTLSELRERYLTTFARGAIEANTLYTAKLHLKRIEESLGKKFLLNGLTAAHLQVHIDRRTDSVSAITAKKEIDTLRSVFNWGRTMSLTTGVFPSAGLVYPKTEEQLPFMAWHEIEHRVKAGGDAKSLWECLYLDAGQIGTLLEFVRRKKAPAWVYPMVFLAAHTGARRSELLRARPEDVDIRSGFLTVREKKRARGMRTTRRVPITKALAAVLRNWLKSRRGSPFLFGHGERPLSVQAAHKALVRLFKKSKWSVVPGWHCFRHSWISIMASKGIDQRIIDDCVGHTTEGQRRRYRHLFPHVTKNAVQMAFG